MQESAARAGKRQIDPETLIDLVKVLALHPHGLRRWSVMRAIRAEREQSHRAIPQRIEDEVERAFRSRCADVVPKAPAVQSALFYLPKEKAGEVWAVYPERAQAVLDGSAALGEVVMP